MHDPIQKISYAHPYVVTSHNNNTMQQYRIRSDQGQRVEIEHVRTLWGHTSSVGAMALDAHIGRLVSGDRAGIKVWNLEGLDDFVVGIENGLSERMEWIGFDSEKIVTVAGNHENNVKVWSFSNSNNK
jgi:WD40 repeat protein